MYKRKKDIKLALVFSRIDQSTLNNREHNPDIQAVSPRSGYMSTHIRDKYNRSSLRQTKASVPHFYEEADEDEEEEENEESSQTRNKLGGIFNGLKSNWVEPIIMKNATDPTNTPPGLGMGSFFSATGSAYSNASYTPNQIEVESLKENDNLADILIEEHPLIAFKNRRHGRD